MKTRSEGAAPSAFSPLIVLLALALAALLPRGAAAITVVEQEGFSLGLGVRIQPRMELERIQTGSGGDWQRDFMVRRTRLTAAGKMKTAQYKIEWKIDGADRLGANPSAQLENGYIQLPIAGDVEMRAGLYDLPMSRDQLTSDSKQLAVDRGNVSAALAALGLVDNGIGFHVLGKGAEGRVEYAVGLFDNRTIPTRFQDVPMVAGRLDLNFGSTKDVYRDAHFGEDKWYSLGLNGSYQGSLQDTSGADKGSTAVVGIDGMLDVPAGANRVFARAEVNNLSAKRPTGGDAIQTTFWMVGLGVLVMDQRLQPMVRYDQVRRDDAVGGGTIDNTYVGGTYFIDGHNLKIQADVRFEGGTGESIDGARLQAQLDF